LNLLRLDVAMTLIYTQYLATFLNVLDSSLFTVQRGQDPRGFEPSVRK